MSSGSIWPAGGQEVGRLAGTCAAHQPLPPPPLAPLLMAAPPCRRGEIGDERRIHGYFTSSRHSPAQGPASTATARSTARVRRMSPPPLKRKIQREVIAMTEWQGRTAAIGARQAVAAQRAQRGQLLLHPVQVQVRPGPRFQLTTTVGDHTVQFRSENINCNSRHASSLGHLQRMQRRLVPREPCLLVQGAGMAEGRLICSR